MAVLRFYDLKYTNRSTNKNHSVGHSQPSTDTSLMRRMIAKSELNRNWENNPAAALRRAGGGINRGHGQ